MPRSRRRLQQLADRLLILCRPAVLWAICLTLLFLSTRHNPVDIVLAVAGLFFLGPAVYSTEEAIFEWGLAKDLDEFEDMWHDITKGDS